MRQAHPESLRRVSLEDLMLAMNLEDLMLAWNQFCNSGTYRSVVMAELFQCQWVSIGI